MAFVGIRHLVVAKITTENTGSAIEYGAGRIMGEPIRANVTITRGSNPLYAGDREVESDNGITAISTEVQADDLTDSIRAYALGDKELTGNDEGVYRQTDAAAPYVGYGYIRVRKRRGVRYFQSVWNHKAQFGENSEATETKKENTEWQTPTVVARGQGVFLDDSGDIAWRDRKTFSNEADAAAWLDDKANLPDAYDPTHTYAVDDLCLYGEDVYKCKTAISTAEAWTPAHWELA